MNLTGTYGAVAGSSTVETGIGTVLLLGGGVGFRIPRLRRRQFVKRSRSECVFLLLLLLLLLPKITSWCKCEPHYVVVSLLS